VLTNICGRDIIGSARDDKEAKIMGFLATIEKLTAAALTLDQFRDKLEDLSTEEIVEGYIQLKPFEKVIGTATETVRQVLVNDETGRFFEGGVTEDNKGHRYLESENAVLQAQKKVRTTLNQKSALELFKSRGLPITRKAVVSDPEKLWKVLELAIELLPEEQRDAVYSLAVDAVDTVEEVTEAQVETNIRLGKLNAEDVVAIYDTKTTYGLYIKEKK